MPVETVQIGSATLMLGDCREILPTLSNVDATISDPPYGVGLASRTTKHTVRMHDLGYDDSEENFRSAVLPAVATAIGISKRAAFFCGIRRLQEYPAAADIGGVFTPNGAGMSRWGFGCYHPVAFYGPRPRSGCWPTAKRIVGNSHEFRIQPVDHPCPKPIAFMQWLVEMASNPGELVLDIFAGSGTTGVACAQLGRCFIGIEIERRYFDAACRRIEAAQAEAKAAA